MATSLEQRAVQLADQLGEPMGAPVQLNDRVRLQGFYNALLIEVDGESWVAAEATVAQLFDQPQP